MGVQLELRDYHDSRRPLITRPDPRAERLYRAFVKVFQGVAAGVGLFMLATAPMSGSPAAQMVGWFIRIL